MSGRKEISRKVRELIIRDRKNGESYRVISKKYEVSKSAVEKLWKKLLNHNQVDNLKGRGRKRCTTPREDSMITRMALRNPTVSRQEIKEELKLNISKDTITRRLKERNLRSRAQRKKPLLSAINKRKRLNFAKKYLKKPLSFWKKVAWSDESKFELYGNRKRKRVWRQPKKAFEQRFTCPTVKHGGGAIMLWGCFSYRGMGNLVPIEGKMTADSYIQIVNENLEESVERMGLGMNFVFQQDNDPKHTAKKSAKFFKDCRIKLLDWPPQSPDLNPIENLWGLMEQKVERKVRKDKKAFLKELNQIWQSYNGSFIRKLVMSIRKRLKAVIKAKGGHTKY